MKLKNILCEKTVNRVNFDNLTYTWSLENEEFEVTKTIHEDLYGMIYNYSNAFYIEKIEKYLSELFGTSIKNVSCRAGRRDFGLSFTGKGIFFHYNIQFLKKDSNTMKLKRLNEAKIEANIPRYLERFISNYHADIREFSVVK